MISSAALSSYEARASDGSSCITAVIISRSSSRQSGNELRTILASRVFRTRTLAIELAGDGFDELVERRWKSTASSTRCQTRGDALHVRGQRLAILACTLSTSLARQPDGATPIVEELQDVGFAELDPHGTALRALCIVALAVPIDTAERHRQRHAHRRPPAHLIEHRTGDPNQMSFVFLAEIALELPAVFGRVDHRGSLVAIPYQPKAIEGQVRGNVLNRAALSRDHVGKAAGRDHGG